MTPDAYGTCHLSVSLWMSSQLGVESPGGREEVKAQGTFKGEGGIEPGASGQPSQGQGPWKHVRKR